jgi:negative regulator of sigma E activity
MKSQLSELSALYDGELEPHELPPLIKAAARDEEMRAAWLAYGVIGDELRGENVAAVDMTAAVMAKLRAEPVVLAPGKLRVSPSHPLLALAASVAGVAVVAWLSLAGNPQTGESESRLATVAPAPTFVRLPEQKLAAHVQPRPAQVAAPAPAARGDMSEYLLAHHIQAATFRLHDSTEHVRSVSMTPNPARP